MSSRKALGSEWRLRCTGGAQLSAGPFGGPHEDLTMRKTWVYNPHTGGRPVPPSVQERTRARILAYAEKHYSGWYTRIDVRFRGSLCYVDAYTEPVIPRRFDAKRHGESREEHLQRLRTIPIHLCRLRYFGDEAKWSMAFFTYSHERYEPCIFPTGAVHGTPEQAFEAGAV